MPSKNVTISQPVLATSEYFNVAYRLLPSGSWVDISPKTNAPFIITGLSAGAYEMKVELIRCAMGDGDYNWNDYGEDYDYEVGCNPYSCGVKYYTFTVISEDCECPPSIGVTHSFSANGIVSVVVTSGAPTVPQEYRVLITDANGQTVVQANPIQIQNYTVQFQGTQAPYNIEIQSICDTLNGSWMTCFTDVINQTSPPPCVGISGVTSNFFLDTSNYQVYLRILFTQSNPTTLSTTVSYEQVNGIYSGTLDGGVVTIPSLSSPIMIPVSPNYNLVDKEPITYEWRFSDLCGNIFQGTATL